MAESKTPPTFNGPIPGIGMTSEPKSRPWKNPPQMSRVEELVPFYMNKFQSTEMVDGILDAVENGIPIISVVESMITLAIMKGKHTIDTGILISPLLIETISLLCEKNGLEAKLKFENPDQIKESTIEKAIRNLQKKAKQDIEENPLGFTDMPVEDDTEEAEVVEESTSGLMSRRS